MTVANKTIDTLLSENFYRLLHEKYNFSDIEVKEKKNTLIESALEAIKKETRALYKRKMEE